MKLRQFAIGLPVILLAGLLVVSLGISKPQASQVPDINLNSIDGRIINPQNYKGQTTLVTFWASTCTTCVSEMPHLIELYNELKHDGFEIIAIAMSYDPPNRVVELSSSKKLPYSIVLDIDGNAAQAFGDIQATPTSFLIGPDGKIIERMTGKINIDSLRQQILQISVAATDSFS